MKNSIIKKAAAAGLVAITLSSLSLGTLTAKASTVATVTSASNARLYTNSGNLITDRALAPNTPWLVGNIVTIDGDTYYQVATNEYLKATDSKLSGDAVNHPATGTIINGDAPLYFTMTKGDFPAARNLTNGSQWYIDRAITDSTGKTYYEVAPNEWISADQMSVTGTVNTAQINAKFPGFTGSTN